MSPSNERRRRFEQDQLYTLSWPILPPREQIMDWDVDNWDEMKWSD